MSARTVSVAAVLVLLLQVPAMAADVAPEAIDGSAWILSALPPGELLDGPVVTLAFEDGQVAGTDGCNRYRGAYEIDDGGLRIGTLAGTMMACPEPVMEQARRYTAALEGARGARLDDDSLVLVDADGETLARFDAQPRSLAETSWAVTGYNNGRAAVVGAAPDRSLTMVFDADGAISGSTGCNRYRASYSAGDKSVDIDVGIVSTRACEEDVMAEERLFLDALRRSSVYRIEGDQLELRDDGGALQVAARRAE